MIDLQLTLSRKLAGGLSHQFHDAVADQDRDLRRCSTLRIISDGAMSSVWPKANAARTLGSFPRAPSIQHSYANIRS